MEPTTDRVQEVVHPRCCGVDVHKRRVVACVLVPGPDGRPQKAIRTFSTMTDDLLALGDWLREQQVTHVAMESTGSYWKPVWNLLEGDFTLILGNAQHIKAVPGRKTDVRDCEWLATLLRHDLIRPSFVPDRADRELRELVRYRTALTQERTRELNRLQKVLEGANLKVTAVASTVGVSVREMVAALAAGATDPQALAGLAKGRLREKRAELERALTGRMGAHQQFLLRQQLDHIEYLDSLITTVSQEIGARLRPFEGLLDLLDAVPGISRRLAEVLVAEIGMDMSRFPTAACLASWAGVCPGNHESAGKRHHGKSRHGNPWLRAALVEAAKAASRKKGSALAARYRRLVVRGGHGKATLAVAHAILVIVYQLLSHPEQPYQELGDRYLDDAGRRDRRKQRLLAELRELGCEVTIVADHVAA